MRFVRILILGIIGLIFGLGWSNVLTSGYFEKWQKLPSPPSAISEFITIFDGTVFVKTVDGSLLQCSTIRNQCWVEGQISEGYQSWIRITNPCDFSSSEFLYFTDPPRNIVACIQGVEQYPEGIGRDTYLLDSDGNVWEWFYSFAGSDPLYATYAPFCCPFLGVTLALVSMLIKPNKIPRSS